MYAQGERSNISVKHEFWEIINTRCFIQQGKFYIGNRLIIDEYFCVIVGHSFSPFDVFYVLM